MTFWADWRNSEEQYANPLQFAHAKLAVPGVASSFSFNDLIEDADGYHLARAVRGNKNIVDAMKDHYNGGGGLRRFNNYFAQRWGNATDCKTSAHNALTSLDKTLSAAQLYLITGSGAAQRRTTRTSPAGAKSSAVSNKASSTLCWPAWVWRSAACPGTAQTTKSTSRRPAPAPLDDNG